MRKLLAWLRSRPIIAGCIAFLALCVCLHFFLNWKAERRWQAYAKEARARGVKLNLTDFAQPKIPDEENFAALPMMRAIMQPGAKSPMALPTANPPSFGDPRKGERLDWQKWQSYFKDAGFISETTESPPRDVLRALEHYAPEFQEWSEWKTRRKCRFPLDCPASIELPQPYLGIFRGASKLFNLRLRAHLALGDSPAACVEFCEVFQASRALDDEPSHFSALAQASILEVLCNSVGDGLADHVWADTELAKIENYLNTVALWKRYRLALQSDRAANNQMYDRYTAATPIKRWNLYTASLAGRPFPPIMYAIKFTPRRFFRDNQLRHNQWADEMLARFDTEATRFDPDGATPSGPRNWDTWFDFYYYLVFRMTALDRNSDRGFLRLQTKLDQTRLAIAVERFRIARGKIPEALAELVPDFLTQTPREIYSGASTIYRPNENSHFLLYSTGPDRRDDGGSIDPNRSEQSQPDWVWPYSRD